VYPGEAPLARSDDLIIEELGDEILIFDTDTDRAHSLTAEAAKVWRSCDGRTSPEELVASLGLDSDTVARALDELSRCDLLEQPPTLAPVREGSTRREMTIKLAKVGAAAAAAPLIVSVAAPAPAMAATIAQCLALTSSGNCGDSPGGCSSVVGCCCCTPPVHPPYIPGSPCAQCGAAGNCPDQCKTCVPCDQDTTLCPTFCNNVPPPDQECHVQCSSGDCPDV
jgi:hypothetical protein